MENQKNMNLDDSLTQEDYMLILFLLWLDDARKKDAQWESFEKELIYKNRSIVLCIKEE